MIMTFTLFLSGVMGTTFAASGIFFLKFWKASRDPFFLYFAFACELIALERIVVVTLHVVYGPHDTVPDLRMGIYIIRLAAFVLMLVAIVQRNRASGQRY